MPKNAQTVSYNHDGEWCYALVKSKEDNGNLNLKFFPSTSPVEEANNVPEGTDSGTWRES